MITNIMYLSDFTRSYSYIFNNVTNQTRETEEMGLDQKGYI